MFEILVKCVVNGGAVLWEVESKRTCVQKLKKSAGSLPGPLGYGSSELCNRLVAALTRICSQHPLTRGSGHG